MLEANILILDLIQSFFTTLAQFSFFASLAGRLIFDICVREIQKTQKIANCQLVHSDNFMQHRMMNGQNS